MLPPKEDHRDLGLDMYELWQKHARGPAEDENDDDEAKDESDDDDDGDDENEDEDDDEDENEDEDEDDDNEDDDNDDEDVLHFCSDALDLKGVGGTREAFRITKNGTVDGKKQNIANVV